jgi:putative colanic acid biosysnthesis UDP-glucose lipid carrier transferase
MPEVAWDDDWSTDTNSPGASGHLPVAHRAAAVQRSSLRLRNSQRKRLADIVVSGFGLLILSPICVLIALMIVAGSAGPVLFRQRRSGLNGTIFNIFKFRTMTVMEDGADITRATNQDKRVTWIGRFLRATRADEIPQLFNVLKGEMSLVGPRPHAIAHDQYYGALVPSYHSRFQVKPGIAGLAQVAGFRGEVRDVWHMENRVLLDLEYIENWSLATDARLFFLAVVVAPFQSGAN